MGNTLLWLRRGSDQQTGGITNAKGTAPQRRETIRVPGSSVICGFALLLLHAHLGQAETTWQQPPPKVLEVMHAPPLPSLWLNPTGDMELPLTEIYYWLCLHPDGQRVAFTARSQARKSEVWVMENFLPELSSTE